MRNRLFNLVPWPKQIVTEGLKMARLAEAFPLKIAQLW
jgi:hypothetical protein